MKNFRDLTDKQLDIFGDITINNYVRANLSKNKKDVAKLLKLGLIEHGPVKRIYEYAGEMHFEKEYSVPISIHMEWCKWCSDNIGELIDEQ